MPRELRAIAQGRLDWYEFATREVGPNEIRVESVTSAAKHGTELAFYLGKVLDRGPWDEEHEIHTYQSGVMPYPFSLGNTAVGHVTEVGSTASRFTVGDRVLVDEVPFCDEHVVDQGKCYKIAEDMPWQSAACLDPSVFALGAVRDGNVRCGDTVAVFGLGAIGLMAIQLARCSGAAIVIGVDPVAHRREIATLLGADAVLDPVSCDVGREIKQATKSGADVCIELSGNVQALQQAIRGVAFGGSVSCAAFPGPYPAGLDLGAEAHINTPNLVFSRACSEPNRDYPRWNLERIKLTCLQMLADGKLTGVPVVEPIVRFENLKEEYPRIVTDAELGVKLGATHND